MGSTSDFRGLSVDPFQIGQCYPNGSGCNDSTPIAACDVFNYAIVNPGAVCAILVCNWTAYTRACN